MPITFPDLPGELRNAIYEDVLTSSLPIEICICRGYVRRTNPPVSEDRQPPYEWEPSVEPQPTCPHVALDQRTSILTTNRQIDKEARPVYYHKNQFLIHAAPATTLRTFLQRIGKQNASFIRHLCIPFPLVGLRFEIGSSIARSGRTFFTYRGRVSFRRKYGPRIVKDPSSGLVPHPSAETMLAIISEHCTNLDTIETVAGTLSSAPHLDNLGVETQGVLFALSLLRSSVPWAERVVVNLSGPQDGKDWAKIQTECPWVVVCRVPGG
ncbi:hypothetical protein OQA88_10462 [Cercophora sp. LCS_1]